MYDRYSERARRAIAAARRVVQDLRQARIAPEHLLAGILRRGLEDKDDGVVARAITWLDRTVKSLYEELMDSRLARGTASEPSQDAFTPAATQILEIAPAEAASLGDDYIDEEHLFLALLQVPSAATSFLSEKEVTYAGTRARIQELLGKTPESRVDEPQLVLAVNPGTADVKELAELLAAFSRAYQAVGGSGITFTVTGTRCPALTS